jgi:hypothetical protein
MVVMSVKYYFAIFRSLRVQRVLLSSSHFAQKKITQYVFAVYFALKIYIWMKRNRGKMINYYNYSNSISCDFFSFPTTMMCWLYISVICEAFKQWIKCRSAIFIFYTVKILLIHDNSEILFTMTMMMMMMRRRVKLINDMLSIFNKL